jgi:hypothetical protein
MERFVEFSSFHQSFISDFKNVLPEYTQVLLKQNVSKGDNKLNQSRK